MTVVGDKSALAQKIGTLEVLIRDLCEVGLQFVKSRLPADYLGVSLREWQKMKIVETRPETFRCWDTLAYHQVEDTDFIIHVELKLQEEVIVTPWHREVGVAIFFKKRADHFAPIQLRLEAKMLGEHVINFSCIHPKSYDIDPMRVELRFADCSLVGSGRSS